MTSWREPKCLYLKLRRVSVVPGINQGVKFINILPKHVKLNHHVGSAYIRSDHRI